MRHGNHRRELKVGGKPLRRKGGPERNERTQRSKEVGPCLSVAERMMRRHMEAAEDDSDDGGGEATHRFDRGEDETRYGVRDSRGHGTLARSGDYNDDDDDVGARERSDLEGQDSEFAINMNVSHQSQRRGKCSSDTRRRVKGSLKERSREQQQARTGSRGKSHGHRRDTPSLAAGRRTKEEGSSARASARGKKVAGASMASRKVQEYVEKKKRARERAKEIAAKRKADAERRKREMQARLRGGEEAY